MGNYLFKKLTFYENVEKDWDNYWNEYWASHKQFVNREIDYSSWPIDKYNKDITFECIQDYYCQDSGCKWECLAGSIAEGVIASQAKYILMRDNYIIEAHRKEFMKEYGIAWELMSIVWSPENLDKFKNLGDDILETIS